MAIGEKKPVVMEADRAVPGGVATLGEDGKLLESQRPEVTIAGVPGLEAELAKKAEKTVPAEAGNVATLGETGSLQDSGVKLEAKQNKLTFDDVPTEGSANPVKSGGVYEAMKWHSNPNLLDNWYFVGGGSQKGYGSFPINQRGQTEYTMTKDTYSIDRWFTFAKGNLSLEDDCISLTWGMGQKLEQGLVERLIGQTVTVSALSEYGLTTATFTFPTPSGSAVEIGLVDDNIRTQLRIVSLTNVRFQIVAKSTTSTIKVYAAKLELGPVQTLAHKEGSQWVPNDPQPNFQQELAKCQRYYWQSEMLYAARAISTNHTICNINFPVEMRVIPAVTIVSYDGTRNAVSDWASGITLATDVICNATTLSKEGFDAIFSATGFPNHETEVFTFKVIADANL